MKEAEENNSHSMLDLESKHQVHTMMMMKTEVIDGNFQMMMMMNHLENDLWVDNGEERDVLLPLSVVMREF